MLSELGERAVVQPRQPRPDRGVGLGEAGEPLVAQAGQDPPLGDLHPDLGLGLVPRFARAGGQHRAGVVGGHLGVGAVEQRLVAMRAGHAGAQVVGHQQRRGGPVELEAAHVRADPALQLLGGARFGVGVVAGPQHRHEQLRLPRRPVRWVDRDRVPGVVEEQLVPAPGAGGASPDRPARPTAGSGRRTGNSRSRRGGPGGTPSTTAAASRPCAAAPDGSSRNPVGCAAPRTAGRVGTTLAPARRHPARRAAASPARPARPGPGSGAPSRPRSAPRRRSAARSARPHGPAATLL